MVGLCGLGTQLRRGVWFDQEHFLVHPNINLILVGPSGIGKDTTIDAAEREIVRKYKKVPVIGGNTIEMIQEHMIKAGDPSCVFLAAGEFTDFFGSKDYKQGIVQGLTTIMSNKDLVDLSLKSAQNRYIQRATMTMFGGSTIEWLHSNMPKDSNEGGFYPRFVILVEDEGKRNDTAVIPSLPPEDLMRSKHGKDAFQAGAHSVIQKYQNFGSMKFLKSAEAMYQDWCSSANKIFPPIANKYSQRAWNSLLRIAMMCTMSRFKDKIETQDVAFGISVMNRVAERIEEVFEPPTLEYKMIKEIMKMIPVKRNDLYKELQKRYKPSEMEKVYLHLLGSNQIKVSKDGDILKGE